MNPQSDLSQSVAFLQWWRPAGPWVLTSIDNDRTVPTDTRTFAASDEVRMREWVQRQNVELQRNVYFHVNPTLRPIATKAQEVDIASMDWLHVDIDPTPGYDLARERERILKMLSAHKGLPAPSTVVFSGGGYQAYWRLREPAPVNGDQARANDLKQYNLQVEMLLGADRCHNLDRIMRLPGTTNWPNKKKQEKGQTPTLAYVLEQHDHAYDLKTFTKAPRRQDTVSDPGGGTEATRVVVSGNVRRNVNLDELPKDLPSRTKAVIVQGIDPDQRLDGDDQSRSAWLFYTVCSLVRSKVDDETIYSIITDPDYKISASVLDKGGPAQIHRYALRQIKQAKEHCIQPELAEMNAKYAVVESIGGRCRIAKESFDPALGRHEVEFLLVDGFKLAHCNRFVMVDAGQDANGNVRQKAVPLGDWWLHNAERRSFERVVFYPGKDFKGTLNLWRGFAFDAIPGDCALYLDHLRKVLCRGNEANYSYLIRWMAYKVQNPHMTGQVAVVCRGKQGTGKGVSARHFGRLFGVHYKHVTNPEHVTGKFNTVLHDAAFVFADECFRNDKAHVSALKALITEETMRVEAKGIDNLESRNCSSLWMNTNEEWAVNVSLDDRRFFVLDVPDDRRKDGAYFAAMQKQMDNGGYEALLHHLLTMDLSDFDVRKVPATDELRRQQQQSMGPAESFWFQCLEDGRLAPEHDEWTGEVITDSFADRFLAGYGKHLSPHQAKTKLGMFLMRAGAGFNKTRLRGQVITWEDSRGKTVRHNSPAVWRFASLEKCRALWDKEFGSREWPAAEDGETRVDDGGAF